MFKKTMKDYITNVKPLHKRNAIISFSKRKQSNARKIEQNSISNPIAMQFLFSECKVSDDPKQIGKINCLNRKAKRKFIVERTIDLHGLTKAEVFEALSRFFANCQSKNIRNVLVITGGSLQRKSVVRSSFSSWINEYFSECIASCSTAKASHGGEGAFYVTLKINK